MITQPSRMMAVMFAASVGRMLPNASDLQYFLEVASTLNISRAAERLGIRQPSLSQALQRLERATGAPLLLRGRTGVRLTKAGERVAARSRELLADWERVRGEALADTEEVRGRFHLGCHVSVALYALPAFLPDFLRKHPQVEIKLIHDLSRKIAEEIVAFRADLGLVINPNRHPELVLKELCRDEVTLWQAKGADASTLICDPELHQSQSVLKSWEKQAGRAFTRVVSTPSLEVAAELAVRGVGVGLLPTRVAARSGAKLSKLAGAPVYEDRLCLAYRADAERTRAARALIDAIRAAEI